MSHAVVKLIGATTMRAGPTVNPKLVKKQCWAHVKVSTEDTISVNLEPLMFHGEWNKPCQAASAICVDRSIARDLELAHLLIPADHLTPDWWIPLNQPVSLSAPSPH